MKKTSPFNRLLHVLLITLLLGCSAEEDADNGGAPDSSATDVSEMSGDVAGDAQATDTTLPTPDARTDTTLPPEDASPPTDTTPPTDIPPSLSPEGTFHIGGYGNNETFSWSNSGGQLILCRHDPIEETLLIRLAVSPENDGTAATYLDLHVCHFDGSGVFGPMDPMATSCPPQPAFDLWWHSTKIYTNDPAANACQLDLTQRGDTLEGTFSCSPVNDPGLVSILSFTNGAFVCEIEQ